MAPAQPLAGRRRGCTRQRALAVAFATQCAGLPLTAALCVFVGVLPVLWVAGWLGGFLLSARKRVWRAEA
jgi:hypothetical protein